jgi:hypothetical protein
VQTGKACSQTTAFKLILDIINDFSLLLVKPFNELLRLTNENMKIIPVNQQALIIRGKSHVLVMKKYKTITFIQLQGV